MERLQGWVVPVENMPGAGGGVVAQWIKAQPADGYTIGITSSVAVTINPALGSAGYVWSDFDYLGSGMQTWSGFVALADKPYNNIAEFVELRPQEGQGDDLRLRLESGGDRQATRDSIRRQPGGGAGSRGV